jgi:hypothetical protein
VLGCISNGWMLLGAHAGDVLFGAGSNASAIWHIAVSAKFMLFVLFFNLFFIQFFFDSSGSFGQFFASLWRGLKMFWFNLPFVLVMSLIFIGVYLILGFIIQWPIIYFYPQFMLPYLYIVSGLSQILIDLLLFMPFVVCVGTNFYVKRVHEQFGVYYKS